MFIHSCGTWLPLGNGLKVKERLFFSFQGDLRVANFDGGVHSRNPAAMAW